jgi:hypothetical protein
MVQSKRFRTGTLGCQPINQYMTQSQSRQRTTPSSFSALQSGQTIFPSVPRSGSNGAFAASTLSVRATETRLSQHWTQNWTVGRFQHSHVGQILTGTSLFNPRYIAMTRPLRLQQKCDAANRRVPRPQASGYEGSLPAHHPKPHRAPESTLWV